MQVWVKRALVVLLVGIIVVTGIRYHRQAWELLSDEQALEAWLTQLGPLGPLGVIFLNALQVVIAFIPGYVMQLAAGFLFGWPAGAIYGLIGMILGGLVAMSLARAFGRPLVSRMVGQSRLERWERMAHLNSLPVWFILMMAPFGDVPYYIAGLTSLPIWKIIVVAGLVRTPSVLIAVAVGAGVISWRSPWIIGGAIALMALALVALRYQDRIEGLVDRVLLTRVERLAARFQAPTTNLPALTAEPQDYDATSG